MTKEYVNPKRRGPCRPLWIASDCCACYRNRFDCRACRTATDRRRKAFFRQTFVNTVNAGNLHAKSNDAGELTVPDE